MNKMKYLSKIPLHLPGVQVAEALLHFWFLQQQSSSHFCSDPFQSEPNCPAYFLSCYDIYYTLTTVHLKAFQLLSSAHHHRQQPEGFDAPRCLHRHLLLSNLHWLTWTSRSKILWHPKIFRKSGWRNVLPT